MDSCSKQFSDLPKDKKKKVRLKYYFPYNILAIFTVKSRLLDIENFRLSDPKWMWTFRFQVLWSKEWATKHQKIKITTILVTKIFSPKCLHYIVTAQAMVSNQPTASALSRSVSKEADSRFPIQTCCVRLCSWMLSPGRKRLYVKGWAELL